MTNEEHADAKESIIEDQAAAYKRTMAALRSDGSGLPNRERELMFAVIPPTNCRPKCTACGDQPLQVNQDQCGLPFCDKCYEEMRRGCNEE